MEAQFTEFQQGACGAGLVTNNRPRWCANIETEDIGSRISLDGWPRSEDLLYSSKYIEGVLPSALKNK